MSSIVACAYNNFSFTKDNIENDIQIIDIRRIKCNVPVPVTVTMPSLHEPAVTVTTVHHVKTVIETQSESASGSGLDSDSDLDSDSETSVSSVLSASASASASSSLLNKTVPSEKVDAVHSFEPDNYYVPKADDTLLWCAFIMINGFERYEMIDNHYIEGNAFKYRIVEDIRSKKALLKPHKLSLSKIEDILVNKPFCHLDALYAIAVCFNLSVCIIQGRKIYEIGRSIDDTKTFVVEKLKGKYGLYSGNAYHKQCALKNVRDNFWSMESITTPIRPLSAYKLPDLVDICKRLHISTTKQQHGEFGSIGIEKKKTKGELYEAICQTI
jgi:hypothetical protein